MFKRLIFILSLFLFSVTTFAQTLISGVVNQYYVVNSVSGGGAASLMTTAGLNPGDTVMLYQSKGAALNTAQTDSFGDINNINNSGNWELLIIESVNTSLNTVTFTCNTTKTYSPPLQLIRVPSYLNANIISVLSCQPYDGMTGGVLCIIVRNNLSFNAGIDVSAKGYTGAQPEYSALSNCAITGAPYLRYSYSALSDSAGFKGGGVLGDSAGMFACGRGKAANGGGGGNGLNSAGAGGGNGGAGGRGGLEASNCLPSMDVGGIGGLSMQTYYTVGKIFMGGGGGAGLSEVVASDPLPGGSGGGIAIIIAGNILCNNKTISAKGEDVMGTTSEESAGGGGAGGTVLLYTGTLTGNLTVNVSGGKGGNSGNGLSALCRGSGGGGGGGMILYNTSASAITKINSGGNPGSVGVGCISFPGVAGSAGSEMSVSGLPITCITFSTNSIINTIHADQTICSGQIPSTLTGIVSSGGASTVTGFLWEQSTDGGTTWTPCPPPNNGQDYVFYSPLTQTTQYRRYVVFSGGEISYSNIVTITVNPLPVAPASVNATQTSICSGSGTMLLHTGGSGTTFGWYTGSCGGTLIGTGNNLSVSPTATTTYYGSWQNGCGNSACANVTVTVNPLPTVYIVQGGGTYCPGEAGSEITLWGSQTGVDYSLLINGTLSGIVKHGTGSAIYFGNLTDTGTYTIRAENTSTACSSIMQGSAIVSVYPSINISFSDIPISCNGASDGSLTANATEGSPPFTYMWNTGAGGPTITGLSQGTYTVTVTDDAGCKASTTDTIEEPSVLYGWGEQAVPPLCHGDSTGMIEIGADGGTQPYSYLWDNGSTDSIITNLPADTFYCTVTDNHGCTIVQELWILDPFAVQPYIDSTSIQPSCYGSSDGYVLVGANGGTGPYTYLWDNGNTSTEIDSLPAGDYYLTCTDANGCTGTAMAWLIEPLQILITADTIVSPHVSNDGYIEILVTNGFAPYSFSWSNSEMTQNIDSLTAGTYTVTVTDDHLCTAVGSYTLNPADLDLVITGDSVLCEGNTGFLQPSGAFPIITGATYLWNTGDTTMVLQIDPTVSQTFSLTITDPASVQYIDSIDVEVVSYPAFHITGDSVICQGSPAVLESSATSNTYAYNWSNGDDTSAITVFPDSTQYYWLTITDIICSAYDSIEVQVSPAFTVEMLGDTTMCLYDTIIISAVTSNTTINNYTYLWSPPYSVTDSIEYPQYFITGTNTVYVTVTAGACMVVQQHDVYVKPRPVFYVSGDSQICSGDSTTLSCNVTGYYYYWFVTPPPSAPIHYGFDVNYTVNPSTTTTYYIGTMLNNCPWGDTITVTVTPAPQMTLSYGDSICSGSQAVIEAALTGTAPWQFYFTDTAETWHFNGITSSPYNITFTPYVSGDYQISGFTDANGCTGNAPFFNITFDPVPVAFAGNDTAVCSNECILNASLTAGDTAHWTAIPPNVNFGNNEDPNSNAWVLIKNTTYSCIWTVGNIYGCVNTDTVKVTYNDTPAQPFAGDDMEIMYSTQAQLNATSPLFGTGHWNLIDGTGIIADSMLANSMATELSLGDNIFRWTVENPPCPSRYDEVVISVLSVTIPTGYSPNGDGKNDNFIVTGLELYPENTLEVFNRWGILVYSSYPYNNNWNGKDVNDKILPDDTYFYVLHLNKREFIKGYVIIHR